MVVVGRLRRVVRVRVRLRGVLVRVLFRDGVLVDGVFVDVVIFDFVRRLPV